MRERCLGIALFEFLDCPFGYFCIFYQFCVQHIAKFLLGVVQYVYKIKESDIMEDSMIRIMLKDEYDRTLRMIEAYKDELKKYPVGSPVIRRHGNNSYMYLTHRDNGKVINKYIGNINSEHVIAIEKDLKRRKYLSDVLAKMEFEKKEIEIYLKAGEKLYGYKKRRSI